MMSSDIIPEQYCRDLTISSKTCFDPAFIPTQILFIKTQMYGLLLYTNCIKKNFIRLASRPSECFCFLKVSHFWKLSLKSSMFSSWFFLALHKRIDFLMSEIINEPLDPLPSVFGPGPWKRRSGGSAVCLILYSVTVTSCTSAFYRYPWKRPMNGYHIFTWSTVISCSLSITRSPVVTNNLCSGQGQFL